MNQCIKTVKYLTSKALMPVIFVVCSSLLYGQTATTNRYAVDPDNPHPEWDAPDGAFLTWQTAATNIQDAVNVAVAAVGDYIGDTVVVYDGVHRGTGTVYSTFGSNVVSVDKTIHLRSVNGPEVTVIDGEGQYRGVYMRQNGSLAGFTISNGYAVQGGGLYSSSESPLISNCVFIANTATGGGSTDYYYSGGGLKIRWARVYNCLIVSNTALKATEYWGGGGIMIANGTGMLVNSTVRWNNADGYGGGIYLYAGGVVSNCFIANNSAVGHGGGGAEHGGGYKGHVLI